MVQHAQVLPRRFAALVAVGVVVCGGTAVTALAASADPEVSVTALTPDHGPVGGGQTVTVQGFGFVDGSTLVQLDGTEVAVVVESPSVLTFVTPAHSAGDVQVAVELPDDEAVSDALPYAYDPAAVPSTTPSATPAPTPTTCATSMPSPSPTATPIGLRGQPPRCARPTPTSTYVGTVTLGDPPPAPAGRRPASPSHAGRASSVPDRLAATGPRHVRATALAGMALVLLGCGLVALGRGPGVSG